MDVQLVGMVFDVSVEELPDFDLLYDALNERMDVMELESVGARRVFSVTVNIGKKHYSKETYEAMIKRSVEDALDAEKQEVASGNFLRKAAQALRVVYTAQQDRR